MLKYRLKVNLGECKAKAQYEAMLKYKRKLT